jgi:2-oxoglutarate dehydrogenase E1 component
MERYLELAAQENWRVVDCSTAAQYFHLLRLQAFHLLRNPRPLVIMAPKSLLRHPLAAATLQELTENTFQPVLDDQTALVHAKSIRRVVLCTGKIAIDLLADKRRTQAEDTAIIRVEQLYPFAEDELRHVLANYPNMREVLWVQEEPRNMGAWNYMAPRLTALLGSNIELHVVSRPERASPAAGFIDMYQAEQEQILEEALHSPVKQYGGEHVR